MAVGRASEGLPILELALSYFDFLRFDCRELGLTDVGLVAAPRIVT